MVFTIHGTRRFRDRVPRTDALAPEQATTTALGDWYATVLFWRPQVALFVNEQTLLPVLMPYAPAASTLDRFRVAAAEVLRAHSVRPSFVDREAAEMIAYRVRLPCRCPPRVSSRSRPGEHRREPPRKQIA
jgi:hypothetical protein